jgi:N-acetylglucosamine-6-sulfatase
VGVAYWWRAARRLSTWCLIRDFKSFPGEPARFGAAIGLPRRTTSRRYDGAIRTPGRESLRLSGRLRRPRLRLLLGCLASTVAVATGTGLVVAAPAAAAPSKLPNIVLIQADDQTLGQFNDEVMPETQRLLVEQGTEFTNYIATTAQCCPSRASLLTGQYPHNNGVTSNTVGYPGLEKKENVLPVWLHEAGYRTMHVGAKYMNGYEAFSDPSTRVAPGWDQWFNVLSATNYYDYDISINGRRAHRGSQPQDYIGRVLADKAKDLIGTYGSRRAYYLQVDLRAPHVTRQDDPYGDCDRQPIPDPRDEGEFDSTALPNPPSFNEEDMSDKPPFLASAPSFTAADRHRLLVRWHCALASMSEVDRTINQLVIAVKRTGEIRRTVFIYVSDNGLFYGEHRIRSGKLFPYEEALHLPFVMRVPKRYRDGASRVSQIAKPVGNIDIAPTILDLAQGEPCRPDHGCRTMDGRSVMPLLTESGHFPDDRGLLTEYREPHLGKFSTCQFAGIRLRDEIYSEYYRVAGAGTTDCRRVNPPYVELYNLSSDPFQLENQCFGGLRINCRQDELQAELDDRLAKLRRCQGIKGRDKRVHHHPHCE